MANKRKLKKNIRRITSDLLAANLMAKYVIPGTDIKLTNDIIGQIIDLEEVSLTRANFDFPRTEADFENGKAFRRARRDYFHQGYSRLVLDFEQRLRELVKMMNDASPRAKATAEKAEKPAEAPAEAPKD